MSDPVFGAVLINPFGLANIGQGAIPVLADIDGDGDLDLFVGVAATNAIKFFRNTGTVNAPVFTAEVSSFGLPVTPGLGVSLDLVDIDGDGDLDAFVGADGGTITYFRNTGTSGAPNFVAQASNFGLTDVGDFANPAFVDIDADGDFDAFVGNGAGVTVFFRNTGSATAAAFTLEASNFGLVDVGTNASPAFADVDGDGDFDALVGDRDGITHFHRNIGSASAPEFSREVYAFGIPNVDANANLALADLDGDGDLDVLLGNGIGDFRFIRDTHTPVRITPSGNTVVTEGGATDTYTVVLERAPTATVTVRLVTNDQVAGNVGKVTFTTENWSVAQTVTVRALNDKAVEGRHAGQIQHTVSSADPLFNGIAGSVGIVVMDNDVQPSTVRFVAPVTNPFGLPGVGSDQSPTFADIDGDGDLDAFLGKYSGGRPMFLRNTGTATAPEFVQETSPFPELYFVEYFNSRPAFADFDADGDLDAFIGYDGKAPVFYRNVGTSTAPKFLVEEGSFVLQRTLWGSPEFVDIDADGDFDVFLTDPAGTIFYRNTGTPQAPVLVKEDSAFGLGGAERHTFADIDGDGDYDAMAGEHAGWVTVFINEGSASAAHFVPGGLVGAVPGPVNVGYGAKPTLVDIDSDGDLDLLVGNDAGNLLLYVSSPNRAPVLSVISPVGYVDTMYDDVFEPAQITLSASDADGNPLTYGIVGGTDVGGGKIRMDTAYGELLLDKTAGTVVFTPDDAAIELLGAAAGVSFTITVTDGIETRQRVLKIDFTQSGTTETKGADVLTGDSGNNRIDGLAGNDTLYGMQGADILLGGAGHDILDGGRGVDRMAGGPGNDTYFVRDVGDYVEELPGAGLDLVLSYIGNYTLPANVEDGHIMAAGNSNLTGNELNNTLRAGFGDNVLRGNTGRDTVSYEYATAAVSVSLAVTDVQDTKGSGFDRLVSIENLKGSEFNDTLTGSAGANVLAGGMGQDILTGGLGADVFVFYWVTESAVGSTRDQISDFSVAQGDRLDLWGIDADETVAGNQAFVNLVSSATQYAAATTFTGANAGPGQLYYDQIRQVLFGNTDADSAAEFSISLKGVTALTMESILG
jgi:Ca2+-binding RTX toxin-like protein